MQKIFMSSFYNFQGQAFVPELLRSPARRYRRPADYGKNKSIGKAALAGVWAGSRDLLINYGAGKLAGAKYVARYFGTVRKTGTTRYYRSMITAFRKKAVQVRVRRQVRAGVYAWVTQQVWQ